MLFKFLFNATDNISTDFVFAVPVEPSIKTGIFEQYNVNKIFKRFFASSVGIK